MPKYEHTLSEEDIAKCKELASARFNSNRKSGITDRKVGKQSAEFTDLQGIGGEFAFCRIFGFNPDKTISPRSSKTDKGDVILPDGTIVDVKTTHYKSGKLLAVPWKEPNVDYYVLMVGTFPSFEYKGLMSKEELLQDSRLTDLGYGETYAATQNELRMSR